MWDAGIGKLLQDQLQRRHPLRVGFANDDGHVASRERECAFVRELDGTRAIYECEIVTKE